VTVPFTVTPEASTADAAPATRRQMVAVLSMVLR
jgi:hypothetical protein